MGKEVDQMSEEMLKLSRARAAVEAVYMEEKLDLFKQRKKVRAEKLDVISTLDTVREAYSEAQPTPREIAEIWQFKYEQLAARAERGESAPTARAPQLPSI